MTREKFDELSKKWQDETALSSVVSDILKNESAKEIIKAGSEVVPFIIDEIRKTHNGHYTVILSKIIGYSPIPTKHYGKIKKMAKDWVKWYDYESDARELVQKWIDSGEVKGFADENDPKIKAMSKLLECDKVQKIKRFI